MDRINPDHIYKLAEEEWQRFLAMLERPAQDLPKLRLLMSRPSPFAEEDQ